MKTNQSILRFALSALVLTGGPGVFGAEGTTDPAIPASVQTASPSSGLMNDWLRKQNHAFSPWDLGGQLRARFENKENGGSFPTRDFRKTGVDNDNTYLLLREKIHAGYHSSWFSAYVEGRNSSTIGDDRNPDPETDRFDLHQAYLTLGNANSFPLSLKLGRQEMIYGDERLIGAADWNNIGRVFDLAKLRYQDQSVWVDVFSGRVVLADNGAFNIANDYDWFSGIYASTSTLIPKQETQLYFLSRNTDEESPTATTGSPQAGGPSARDIYSLGLRIKSLPGEWNGWDYTAELVGQLGSVNLGGTRLDQEAFAANAGSGYTWSTSFGSPRLGLGYSFASGDSDPSDGKSGTFENLFPTNHRKYGNMDFVGWRNLHDPRISASIKPAKAFTLDLEYHLFWLADTADFFYPLSGAGRNGGGYGRNASSNSFVGSELDLDLKYSPKPWLTIQGGYGHFFVGQYVKQSLAGSGGSTNADWIYVQTAFRF